MRPCRGWIGTPGVLSECTNERGVDKIRVLNAEERGGVEREVFVLFLSTGVQVEREKRMHGRGG